MSDSDRRSVDRPTPEQTVYDQYWTHIRHVEDEMWSFTRIWAVVITAIFGILGTELPTAAKIGTAGFGILLSVLGFFVVYTLRVPFFDFLLTAELIARHDFGLQESYRRFQDEPSSDLNKGVDVHDVLIGVYTLTAGVLLATIGFILDRTIAGAIAGGLLMVLLVYVYRSYVIPKFDSSTERIRQELWEG